ncbi:hypothetical protein CPter91_4040 [Collimonas pratensis]|uniref:Uncharacterized protein n=1 Tax=Collimonas pratensis TaxID=279113 RepID=A0A127Q8F5_9BURK|nr:hypothetical protein CPter91_4040 [Collimonas pratensis]
MDLSRPAQNGHEPPFVQALDLIFIDNFILAMHATTNGR